MGASKSIDALANTVPADAASDQKPVQLDVRSRLLAHAGPVFANLGFDRATLREICGEANVNIASVAYYFGDKMGLYRAVIREVRDQRERRFPFPDRDTDVAPRESLTRLVHTMLSRMLTGDDTDWEAQLLMREMMDPTIAFRELAEEFFRPIFNQLKSTFAKLIKQSRTESATDIPDHVLDQLAISVVGQCVYYGFGRGVIGLLRTPDANEDHFEIDSLCQHITAVMIAAAHHQDFEADKRATASMIEQIKKQSKAI